MLGEADKTLVPAEQLKATVPAYPVAPHVPVVDVPSDTVLGEERPTTLAVLQSMVQPLVVTIPFIHDPVAVVSLFTLVEYFFPR